MFTPTVFEYVNGEIRPIFRVCLLLLKHSIPVGNDSDYICYYVPSFCLSMEVFVEKHDMLGFCHMFEFCELTPLRTAE